MPIKVIPKSMSPNASLDSMPFRYTCFILSLYGSEHIGEKDAGEKEFMIIYTVMASLYDRVFETSTTSGTGSFTLDGATDGYRTFLSTVGNNETYYCIEQISDSSGLPDGNWEVGVGTIVGGTTLQRDTVIASSNSNSTVNFPSGTKNVFLPVPSSVTPTKDNANDWTALQSFRNAFIGTGTATVGEAETGVLYLGNSSGPSGGSPNEVKVFAADYNTDDSRLYIYSEAGVQPVIIGNQTVQCGAISATSGFVATVNAVTNILIGPSPTLPADFGRGIIVSRGFSPSEYIANQAAIWAVDAAGVDGQTAIHVAGEGTTGFVSLGTITARQKAGTAGTDEVRISHDGTNGFVTSQDGDLRLGGGGVASILRVSNTGVTIKGSLDFLNSSDELKASITGDGHCVFESIEVSDDLYVTNSIITEGFAYFQNLEISDYINVLGDVGLARKSAGVLSITNGSTGAGAISVPSPASGAGLPLALSASSAVSGNTNGGNVLLTPGAKSGSGLDGTVCIKGATTTPTNLMEIHNSAGTIVDRVNSTGCIVSKPGVDASVTDMHFGCADTNSGMFLFGSELRFGVGGTQLVIIGSSRFQVQSTQLRAPAGTAGTPGLTNASDTTTGIYRAGSNALGIATSGVGRFIIDSAGGISTPPVTPTQIAGNVDNYSPGSNMFQRWSSDASRNVTGMVAPSFDGERREIWNVGSQNIVLMNDVTSTAANRFLTTTGADLTLLPGKCAIARYDLTTQRWRVYLTN